jgi:hypothetical protein
VVVVAAAVDVVAVAGAEDNARVRWRKDYENKIKHHDIV